MSAADSQRASELYQKKDWSGLANLATAATRADSNDGWGWYYLGLAEDGMGKREEAAGAYEKGMNLVPGYLFGSIVQLLAQDYAATRQTGKLTALYHEMQKTHPDVAASLQPQFRDVLGAQVQPTAPVPEISPRTLQAMTAEARRNWRRDAIPVLVDVRDIGRGFQVAYDFYSPASRAGLQMVQALGGTSNLPAENPQWPTSAIPDNFLALDAAMARASAEGARGTLDHAFLYRSGGAGEEAVDLNWDLAVKSDQVRGVSIPAYIMPRDRFGRLLAAGERGDTTAQVLLARVYMLGLIGPPDAQQAFVWARQAAALRNPEGENMLGQMYEFGRGTRPDFGTAVHWYQMAANTGFAPAEYNLGLMYESGRGVPRNDSTAEQWISKAAHQGLGDAIGELPYVTARARGEQKQAQAAAARRPTRCPWSFQYYNTAARMCLVSPTKMMVGMKY